MDKYKFWVSLMTIKYTQKMRNENLYKKLSTKMDNKCMEGVELIESIYRKKISRPICQC